METSGRDSVDKYVSDFRGRYPLPLLVSLTLLEKLQVV
jgi:hypothetical protein